MIDPDPNAKVKRNSNGRFMIIPKSMADRFTNQSQYKFPLRFEHATTLSGKSKKYKIPPIGKVVNFYKQSRFIEEEGETKERDVLMMDAVIDNPAFITNLQRMTADYNSMQKPGDYFSPDGFISGGNKNKKGAKVDVKTAIMKRFPGLSIGHKDFGDNDVREVSVCAAGARPGTIIIDAEYSGGEGVGEDTSVDAEEISLFSRLINSLRLVKADADRGKKLQDDLEMLKLDDGEIMTYTFGEGDGRDDTNDKFKVESEEVQEVVHEEVVEVREEEDKKVGKPEHFSVNAERSKGEDQLSTNTIDIEERERALKEREEKIKQEENRLKTIFEQKDQEYKKILETIIQQRPEPISVKPDSQIIDESSPVENIESTPLEIKTDKMDSSVLDLLQRLSDNQAELKNTLIRSVKGGEQSVAVVPQQQLQPQPQPQPQPLPLVQTQLAPSHHQITEQQPIRSRSKSGRQQRRRRYSDDSMDEEEYEHSYRDVERRPRPSKRRHTPRDHSSDEEDMDSRYYYTTAPTPQRRVYKRTRYEDDMEDEPKRSRGGYYYQQPPRRRESPDDRGYYYQSHPPHHNQPPPPQRYYYDQPAPKQAPKIVYIDSVTGLEIPPPPQQLQEPPEVKHIFVNRQVEEPQVQYVQVNRDHHQPLPPQQKQVVFVEPPVQQQVVKRGEDVAAPAPVTVAAPTPAPTAVQTSTKPILKEPVVPEPMQDEPVPSTSTAGNYSLQPPQVEPRNKTVMDHFKNLLNDY